MLENGLAGGHYAEPYAGGSGVAMELLLTGSASHVHLNDSCKRIHAFWHSILGETEEFCRRISRAPLTVAEWQRQKQILARPAEVDPLDLGFSAFYLNRCNRSGILGGGLIGGLNQEGDWLMDARFPRGELIKRIETIALRRRSISIRNWDAERFIRDYVPRLPRSSLVYLDPPYFHKAERLYLNHYRPKDHARIARVIQARLHRPWVVSYDAEPEVVRCYAQRRSITYDLHYNAAAAYTGKEIVFFSKGLRLPRQSALASIDTALRRARRARALRKANQ